MKKFKLAILSLAVGLVFSLAGIALANKPACDPTIDYGGRTCVLVGENCGGNVCVCAYNCGP
jgi:hypothetical protein